MEDWRLEVRELIDAGDDVVAILHQSGRSKTTGLEVDMDFAQVWTIKDGKQSAANVRQPGRGAARGRAQLEGSQ